MKHLQKRSALTLYGLFPSLGLDPSQENNKEIEPLCSELIKSFGLETSFADLRCASAQPSISGSLMFIWLEGNLKLREDR